MLEALVKCTSFIVKARLNAHQHDDTAEIPASTGARHGMNSTSCLTFYTHYKIPDEWNINTNVLLITENTAIQDSWIAEFWFKLGLTHLEVFISKCSVFSQTKDMNYKYQISYGIKKNINIKYPMDLQKKIDES